MRKHTLTFALGAVFCLLLLFVHCGSLATRGGGRALAAEASAGKRGTLEFLKARRERRWTRVPRKVLTFYYTWYGRPERHGRWVHWSGVRPEAREIASSTNYPALGAYDSHDPKVIDSHIDMAKGCGIDGFICTWWGQGSFDDRALARVLERAKEKDFSITIYWETVPGSGKRKIDRAVDDLLYVLQQYGSHPAFLKLAGKPVVFVYGRVMQQVRLEEWPGIITRVEQRYPRGFLLIADGYSEGYARLFDGIHTYNICGWVRGKTAAELRNLSRASFQDAVQMAKRNGKISCITVIPGYDDRKIRSPGLNAERLDGVTYRVLWEEAVAADPDWVLITSWNEWHEGSEIEPSFEHGDRYIQSTTRHTGRFKSTPYSQVEIPELPTGLPREKARALEELFAGTRVGLLPDFRGDAVFWLAETEVELAEVSWEDVLDNRRFNARRFPVVIYAGYESYRQTVKKRGDVDEALVRYLTEGGLLMALASGPYPFFYNGSRRAVGSAAKFGIPLAGSGIPGARTLGGWESPPPGVKLAFAIDSEVLKGLPRQAAFPAAGDLRWRPVVGARLAEGDIYLPLAQLKDSAGRHYGDGIVYIEHKSSPPKNGKNIYAWMRMTDVLERNDLLFALFRLAAEKMSKDH